MATRKAPPPALQPTPSNLKLVRTEAGLTQEGAAAMVGLNVSRWAAFEQGKAVMDGKRWELFLILCGRHADWLPAAHVKVPRAGVVAS